MSLEQALASPPSVCPSVCLSLSLHLSVLSAEWRKGEPYLCLSFFSFCWANGSRNALSVFFFARAWEAV